MILTIMIIIIVVIIMVPIIMIRKTTIISISVYSQIIRTSKIMVEINVLQ